MKAKTEKKIVGKIKTQSKDNKKEESKWKSYENLDKVGEIAVYYGFSPYKTPEAKKSDVDKNKDLCENDYIVDITCEKDIQLNGEEKMSLLKYYEENKMNTLPQPIMMYFKDSLKINKKDNSNRYANLEILGNPKSIAEATLIQTAKVMLEEEGYQNICVEINSIGDKESMNKFTKELANYYRKHIDELHDECKHILKDDPFLVLACQHEKCKGVNVEAPKSMNFLSDYSRTHFKEVLEYLEALEIPYQINNNLLGNKKYCNETVFEIVSLPEEDIKVETLALGYRYDAMAKRIGLKKDVAGVGVSFFIKNRKPELRKEITKVKKPQVYFIQLGFEAKLLSLKVIEILRQAKIPVLQSLPKDKLGAQVSVAEKTNTPFTIIMGKKEAVEGTVMVRNMDTRFQDTVKIEDLASYMKKLEK